MTRRAMVLTALLAGVWAAIPQAQAQWRDVIRNLSHPKAEVRLDAVQKLGDASYVDAIAPVAELITDPDDRVQAAAIDAELTFFLTESLTSVRVMGMGSSKSRAQMAFDEGPLVRGSAAAPPVLISRLIAAIRDENARIRFDAVHALGFIAEPPLDPGAARALAAELDHYDPIIRAATARVVGRLRDVEAADKLLVDFGDSNALVRQYAIEATGWIRNERAVAPLRDLVARGRGEEPAAALFALARIASADDLALFRQRLGDKSASMRRAAVEGLGRVRDQESLAAITQLAESDSSPSVRLAAAFARQLMGDVQSHTIAAHLVVREETAQAREYLFELGRAAVPGIQAALQAATDSRHRADLIQAIGYLGAAEDAASLDPYARDRDERVSRAAAHALTRLRR